MMFIEKRLNSRREVLGYPLFLFPKTKIVLIFLLIALCSFASAIEYNDIDLIGAWGLDDVSGDLVDAKNNAKQKLNLQTVNLNYQKQPIPSDSPTSNYSVYMNGTSQIFGNNTVREMMNSVNQTGQFTYGAWVNISSFPADGWIISNAFWNSTEGWSGWGIHVSSDGGGIYTCTERSQDTGNIDVAYSNSSKILHIICKHNSTGVAIYINGTEKVYTASQSLGYNRKNFTIGFQETPDDVYGKYETMTIDQIFVMNRSLDDSEISDIMNNWFGEVSTGLPATPTIVDPTPISGYTSNVNVTLNVTHSTETGDVRYYLYFSTNQTLTENHLYINNATRTGAEYKSFTTNVTDGTYYYKWKVQNITNGKFSTNTTQRTLIIDSVTNAIRAYFYDEKSNTLIRGETFSLFLETTGVSNTYSTTDNPYIMSSLSKGLYSLEVSSANYPERQYFNINVTNTSTTNLNVYLANTTYGSEITFNTVDSNEDDIDNVNIDFYRTISGVSTLMAQEQTDYNGNSKLYLDTNYEYLINFSKSGYQTKTINLEPASADSPYTIYLYSSTVVVPPIAISYKIRQLLRDGVTYNLTFTNKTNVVHFDWYDSDNYVDFACMKVFDFNRSFYSNCSNLSTGFMNFTITEDNRTYIAKAYVKKDDREYLLKQFDINLMLEVLAKFGKDAIIITWIVFLTMSLIAIASPVASIFMGTITLVSMYYIGMLPIGATVIMGIISVAIVLAIAINKDKRRY